MKIGSMSSLKISLLGQQYVKIIMRYFNHMYMLIIAQTIMSFISAKAQTNKIIRNTETIIAIIIQIQ